jgi:hypothetical protein
MPYGVIKLVPYLHGRKITRSVDRVLQSVTRRFN